MANVLTDLAADIYRAADVVGRELVGVIPSATLNTDASRRVAQNDVIRSHFTRAATVGTVTPSMTIPEGDDQTIDTKTMTLDSTASVKIPWTGEDIKHVNNGSGFETIYGDQVRQAMRAIVNEDVAIQSAFTANVAFHQAAVEIGMRPLAQPDGGDAAVDRLTVQDPFSGLIFEVAAYKGYNKAMFDVSCLYGYKVWKPDFVCILQG
ncbi:MAG: hypothetical protein EBU35_14830 [Marivivens sp.]|nr:hypothetical protein [Marivivens sp.]